MYKAVGEENMCVWFGTEKAVESFS